MDLKLPSLHPDHFPEAFEIDLAETVSNTAGEHEPCRMHRAAIRHTSNSEELDYLKARLRTIGLDVGQD